MRASRKGAREHFSIGVKWVAPAKRFDVAVNRKLKIFLCVGFKYVMPINTYIFSLDKWEQRTVGFICFCSRCCVVISLNCYLYYILTSRLQLV